MAGKIVGKMAAILESRELWLLGILRSRGIQGWSPNSLVHHGSITRAGPPSPSHDYRPANEWRGGFHLRQGRNIRTFTRV